MRTTAPTEPLCIADIPIPLSRKLATMREQLSGMFNAGELDALDDDARFALRGLELTLLEVSQDAGELENATRAAKYRRPYWLRHFVK